MAQADVLAVVDTSLGEECESFLQGRYLEWLKAEGLPVPPWAYLNRVAHADRSALRGRAASLPGRPRSWDEAQAFVETAVLAGVAPQEFESVQLSVLLPLEFELMHHVPSPGAIIDRVCRAIY